MGNIRRGEFVFGWVLLTVLGVSGLWQAHRDYVEYRVMSQTMENLGEACRETGKVPCFNMPGRY